jgi:glycosyltransferase involved in cell wall biosynthesis
MISTFYGVELKWVRNEMPYLKWFLKWVINQSDGVTAISSYTAKEIEEIVPRQISIIPYGASVQEKEYKDPMSQTPSNQKNILFVGRLVERKGVPYLIEAFGEVLRKIDAVLTIVGEGSEKEKLEELVKSKNLENKVYFPGFVQQEELKNYFQKCDVFVLPAIVDSKGDTEGLGVVLIEAMNYKKPVIASNVGGIVDIIIDKKTGILVPEKDSKKMAEAIVNLLADEEQALRLGEEGFRFVKDNFNWDHVTGHLVALYRTLI